jgi:hypothetical protein
MSLVLFALAAGTLVGLACGGSLRRLGEARLRWVGVLLAGAVCELAGSCWGAGDVGDALLIVGYVLLVAFALRNAALTGMLLVAIGLAANLTVIALDGGMPVAGIPSGHYGVRHHAERSGDQLIGLADTVHLAPLGEIVSAGDIVLSLGVATVMVGLIRPRPRPRRRRAPGGLRPVGNRDRLASESPDADVRWPAAADA